jgi:hypothetical protein
MEYGVWVDGEGISFLRASYWSFLTVFSAVAARELLVLTLKSFVACHVP